MKRAWIGKSFEKGYTQRSKRYKAAYLDLMDLLYGDLQDEETIREGNEPCRAALPGRDDQDQEDQ